MPDTGARVPGHPAAHPTVRPGRVHYFQRHFGHRPGAGYDRGNAAQRRPRDPGSPQGARRPGQAQSGGRRQTGTRLRVRSHYADQTPTGRQGETPSWRCRTQSRVECDIEQICYLSHVMDHYKIVLYLCFKIKSKVLNHIF